MFLIRSCANADFTENIKAMKIIIMKVIIQYRPNKGRQKIDYIKIKLNNISNKTDSG